MYRLAKIREKQSRDFQNVKNENKGLKKMMLKRDGKIYREITEQKASTRSYIK